MILQAYFIFFLVSIYGSGSIEVSFLSSAPSGNLQILGTLEIPESQTKVPAVILLVGSGPTGRNESISFGFPSFIVNPPRSPPCSFATGSLSVFTQLSAALVAQGFAVLRYDKRECAQPNPGCPYLICTEPGQLNCVDIEQLNPNDMVTDAISAVNFLRRNYSDLIDPNEISILGHSQGCSVAPYVANVVPIKKVVQLMGIGVSLDYVILKQLAWGIELYQTGFDICHSTNENPELELQFQQLIVSTTLQLGQFQYWLPLIKNGSLSNSTLTIGGTTVKYWLDVIRWGDWTELYQTMSKTAQTTPILAINSAMDYQVWPEFYRSLHAVILSLPNSKVTIIDNLTHLLVDNSLTSNQISPELVQTVVSFLKNSDQDKELIEN